MSFKKVCICDNCNKIISSLLNMYENLKDYEIGYIHMCKECQLEQYGYFQGDMKETDPSIVKIVDDNFWNLI